MDRRTRIVSEYRRCFRNVFVVVLSVQAWVRGHSEAVLVPPTQVHLNGSQLTWTPGSEESSSTYTVEYLRFGSEKWDVDPDCLGTPLTSCRPGSVRSVSRPGEDCVQLRVRAERAGSESEPVQACSRIGGLCSPQAQLTAGPGSVTVRLNRNHSLFLDHAAHAEYRVYFGPEGEELQEHRDSHSSTVIQNLEAGQRYCVKVQFTLHDVTIGPPSCVQCETVPQSSRPTQTAAITAVVVVVLVLLLVGFFYVVICKQKKIKEVLRPPFTIPQFFQEPIQDRDLPVLRTPSEENFDVVCSLTPTGSSGDQNLLLEENRGEKTDFYLLTLSGSDLTCT